VAERLLRSLTWPLIGTALFCAVLRMTLLLRHSGRPDETRAVVAAGAVAAALLSWGWGLKLGAAYLRALWRARAARRLARKTRTLVVRFPPVMEAQVDANSARLAQAEAELRAHRRLLATITEGMSSACRAAGVPDANSENAEMTAPMLRLVGGERDSA
jgi:hypothetical protein